MKLKLFGTEIYISFFFAALIAFLLATDRTGLIIPTLFASFIHEGGHLFAMWLCGEQPKKIKLIPASMQIVRNFSVSARNEMAIALCGPAANIAVFLCLFLNYLLSENATVLTFALLNLILAVFNLLPVSGLDGGTVLKNLWAKKTDIYSAEGKVRILTFALSVFFLSAGVFLALRGETNISLFIMAVYLFICAVVRK